MYPAVRPTVHLQYNHCRSRNSKRTHIQMFNLQLVFFSAGRISALPHLHDSKQRLRDRAALLLSPCCCFITRRRPATSSVVAVKRHRFFTRHKKHLVDKVAQNISSTLMSMIQASFGRAWIALQYVLGKRFPVERFSCYASLSSVKNQRAKLPLTMGRHHMDYSERCQGFRIL